MVPEDGQEFVLGCPVLEAFDGGAEQAPGHAVVDVGQPGRDGEAVGQLLLWVALQPDDDG